MNEQCQRSVDKPTLFFVPGLKFVGNLIESNFTAKQLNKIILVSYGFKNSGKSISAALENRSCGFTGIKGSLALERDRFLWASINYIDEVIVLENFDEEFWGVSELRVEFLDVAADVDMNSNVPSMCVFLLNSFFFSVLLFDGEANFAGLSLKEKFFLNFELELEYNSFFAFE